MKISEIITEDITRRGLLKGIAGAAAGGVAMDANANPALIRQTIIELAKSNPVAAARALKVLSRINPNLAKEIEAILSANSSLTGLAPLLLPPVAKVFGAEIEPAKINGELISYLSSSHPISTDDIKSSSDRWLKKNKWGRFICTVDEVTDWLFQYFDGSSQCFMKKTNDEYNSIMVRLGIDSGKFRPKLATRRDRLEYVDLLVTGENQELWAKMVNKEKNKYGNDYTPFTDPNNYRYKGLLWKIMNTEMKFQTANTNTAMGVALHVVASNMWERFSGICGDSISVRESVNQSNERTTLGDLATIKTNFPDADFWIIRKGSEDKVGMPTKDFSPEHIGVKVTATDVLDPNYLRYVFEYLVQRGYFRDVARGTLRLKHIQTSDVSRIPLGVKRKPKPTPNYGYKDVGYKMNEPRFKE